MKKTSIMLLVGVLMLFAVEWDVTQITNDTEYYNVEPIMILDAQGHPHILFTQWNEEVKIVVATQDAESWVFDEVAEVSELFMSHYSLDIDAVGNTFVAYSDFADIGNGDIYIANDMEGDFVSTNVTNDALFQAIPVLRLDQGGVPCLIYVGADTPDDSISLYYGWMFEDALVVELITQDMYQDDYIGYDFVFKPGSIQIPQVFYIGIDDYLWHATPGELIWTQERLNELSSEWPSAVADPLGSFHVAYDVGGSSIHYITDMSGTWQDEIVFDQLVPEGGNEQPSLALEIVFGKYLGIGNPHVVWMHADAEWWYDIFYSHKGISPWAEEPVTSTEEKDEITGYGPYFAIDVEGYGHLTYCAEDDEFVTQIFYAKSTEPLFDAAITESSPQYVLPDLEVIGPDVHLTLPSSQSISLDLYDASGRRVGRITSGQYPAGEHTIPINSSELTSGVYFVRGVFSGKAASAKFVVTH